MRTTLLLPDDLYAEVKRTAADDGRTVTSFVEEALRAALLKHRAAPATRQPYRVDAVAGRGLQPGVDLTDTAALTDLMEGR